MLISEIINRSCKEGYDLHWELQPHPEDQHKIICYIRTSYLPCYRVEPAITYIEEQFGIHWPEVQAMFC